MFDLVQLYGVRKFMCFRTLQSISSINASWLKKTISISKWTLQRVFSVTMPKFSFALRTIKIKRNINRVKIVIVRLVHLNRFQNCPVQNTRIKAPVLLSHRVTFDFYDSKLYYIHSNFSYRTQSTVFWPSIFWNTFQTISLLLAVICLLSTQKLSFFRQIQSQIIIGQQSQTTLSERNIQTHEFFYN